MLEILIDKKLLWYTIDGIKLAEKLKGFVYFIFIFLVNFMNY